MASFLFATLGTTGALYRYFTTLSGELASRGHQTALLLDNRREDLVDPAAEPAIFTWPSARPTHLADARFLHRLIRERRVDCVVGTFSAINLCVVVGLLDRVPVRVAWGRTITAAIRMDTDMPEWKRRLLRLRRRIVLRLATSVLANSEATRADLRRAFGVPEEKIAVLHNALPELPVSLPGRRGMTVVYAGRFSPCKGLDVLIEAIPAVISAHPECRFVFAGDGPTRGDIERLAAARGVARACEFLGVVPGERVHELMAGAAFVVTPSIHEAFGFVNLEAHALGAPVVASDTDGIPDVVVDGETGLLVPPGDSAALATAMSRLLGDDELRAGLGRGARARFEALFGPGRIAAHADFFEDLAGGRRRDGHG